MLKTLGWREWVALPDLGMAAIKAKVDTGARSSALHVLQQERVLRRRVPHVRFWLEAAGPDSNPVESVVRIADERPVTDSGGHTSWRPFILTRIQIGEDFHEIELNLMPRHGMRFPMLLGRTSLAGRFLVDAARSYLSGRALAPRKRRKAAPTAHEADPESR
ncbi:MAG: ATP-dependent zinc protease [Xanthomonadales bacterium]|nr:ATP-dependent zinc protease [Xanthomonadales bacterium]MCB1635532.1 ATP-dependent zinc protease [Xanthomonadales bacterium]MCB1642839.1 ATP-dependent zinc protease [Xanthomonadales bacterium]